MTGGLDVLVGGAVVVDAGVVALAAGAPPPVIKRGILIGTAVAVAGVVAVG